MSPERYLERVKQIDVLIINRLHDYERWFNLSRDIMGFPRSEKADATSNFDKIPNAVANYCDIERYIQALKAEREVIIRNVEKLPRMEYIVLYDIFINPQELRLKDIGYKINRGENTVKKIKKRGLRRLKSIIDQTTVV